LTLGAGLGVDLIPNRLELLAEVYGATGFSDFFARGSSPFEIIGGLRARPVCALVIGLAAGTGLSRGYGSPDVRAVLQIGVSTASCEEAPIAETVVEATPVDTDGDGVFDPADRCPTEAEDRDEWEDADGCPDPDNDGDQVLDADDGAPLDPEDRDGFQDADGVPDPDNDADTVLDADDQCPLDPGSPAAHGCPVTIRVDRETGTIFILQRVEFATNRDVILDRSFPILEEVRAVLASNPVIERLRIEGHTDDRGRDAANLELSRRRAASVVRWLVEHGVVGARLESWGCGELHPTEPNRTSAGRQSNRRVEFHIVTPAPANGAHAPEGCVQAE
jgi:outer membrane protein OmpA-like peptidoglycan-associated protein